MEQTYLPGDALEQIIDLMKEKSMTQQELAARTGMTVGTFSRFQCGKIDKLSADNVLHCPDLSGVHRFSAGGK